MSKSIARELVALASKLADADFFNPTEASEDVAKVATDFGKKAVTAGQQAEYESMANYFHDALAFAEIAVVLEASNMGKFKQLVEQLDSDMQHEMPDYIMEHLDEI